MNLVLPLVSDALSFPKTLIKP